MKYIWGGIIFLCISFFSCVKDGGSNPYEIINHVAEGDPVPDFTVSDDKGNTFSSSEFTGKRSLLVFFNTGCDDCQEIMPDLNNKVWETYKDNPDYLLITISRGETAEAVNNYWGNKKNNFTMPAYLDPDRRVFSYFANSTVPRLYIINKEGIIERMFVEKLNVSIEKLIELIE